MKSVLVLFLFVFSSLSWAHCPMEFNEVDLCSKLTWTHGPLVNEDSHFRLQFWEEGDQNNVSVSPQFDVKIYSWMIMSNGLNHGGPSMTWSEVIPGEFEVKDAKFFMHGSHGYWEIRVDLMEDGQVVSTGAQRVNFSMSGNH